MNKDLIAEFYNSIVNSCYRSVIVSGDRIKNADRELCNITRVSSDVYYATLTDLGVIEVLSQGGILEKDANSILSHIKNREIEQVNALIGYLRLEQQLNSSVVFVMLVDGGVHMDEKSFRKMYSLPLDMFFSSITRNGFLPVRTDTIKTSSLIEENEYSKFLFANKKYRKILSVFIDVARQGDLGVG